MGIQATASPSQFAAAFAELARIGRDPGGGWRRLAWTPQDRAARDWFRRRAGELGLSVEQDRNANLWAWWGRPGADAVVTGSHLDTVPNGGAYDGALGVVSGLLAVEALRRAGVRPHRPLAVVVFTDEEGSRFNTPCLGSRLLAGDADPAPLLGRRDAAGTTLADAATAAGVDPGRFGPDPDRLAAVGTLVELHVEQGRGLVDLGVAVAAAGVVWPHVRWRVEVTGETNHAGTTRLDERRDALLVAVAAVVAAREQAAATGARATVGALRVEPGAANAVPGRVRAWLDVRAPDQSTLERLLAGWREHVDRAAREHGCDLAVGEESRAAGASFDPALRRRLLDVLSAGGKPAPVLDTAAGHDAGILAVHVPAGMLFVRNPTGVSHSPAEAASDADCAAGVAALAACLAEAVGA